MLVAAFGSTGVHDPRQPNFPEGLGTEAELAGPAARLRTEIKSGDVLFPFSPVHLAALPASGRARTLPRAQPELLARALRRVELPAGSLFVSVPVADTEIRLHQLQSRLGPGFVVEKLGGWLILERRGPLRDRASIAAAISKGLREAQVATVQYNLALAGYYRLGIYVAEGAERQLQLDRAG